MQHVIAFVGDRSVLEVLKETLSQTKQQLNVIHAASQEDAIAAMQPLDRAAIVLTDLPNGTDIGSLETIASSNAPRPTPIVVLTSQENEQLAVKALRAVAASYIPIRLMETELLPTMTTVLAMAKAQKNRMRVMESVTLWHSEFELENDSTLIGPLVRYLQESTQRIGLLTEPGEETRLGIALEEALRNSMHHGNLEVSSALREEDDDAYYAMVKQRQTELPYSNRRITVRAEFSREYASFTIKDEGPGFDVSEVPDPTDPENVERVCGRGMLLMRTFMDEVTYNDTGNEVTLSKRRKPATDASQVTS